MRRPRRQVPGQFLDLTIRCWRSESRLRPDDERTNLVGFWLAKAQARFSGVRIFAVCQMSNHLHLVVEDTRGEVSEFMQYFVGHLAKGLNKLDQVRGGVFERRFAEIVILDDEALARRVAYAINNPVEANLVRKSREWTGVCLFAGPTVIRKEFTRFNERAYFRALEEAERSGSDVNEESGLERADLVLEALAPELASRIAATVEARGDELGRAQPFVSGMERARAVSPFDRPKMSSRSPMPLCFASSARAEIRSIFQEGWRMFVAAFRRASAELRAGREGVVFPPFSYRPSIRWSLGTQQASSLAP